MSEQICVRAGCFHPKSMHIFGQSLCADMYCGCIAYTDTRETMPSDKARELTTHEPHNELTLALDRVNRFFRQQGDVYMTEGIKADWALVRDAMEGK